MVPASTRGRCAAALVPVLALLLVAGPPFQARPAQAATTFTVTTTGDEPDMQLTDPVCDVSADLGTQCTLRAAIQEANATPGPDIIAFAIPGDGVQTIRPASELPPITNRVAIDGYSQPGSKPNTARTGTNAVPRIELDGSAIVNYGDWGLNVASGDGTLIRGLVVNRFDNVGIEVEEGATNTRIAGCFVGADAAGAADRGNAFGVYLDGGAGVRIGGTAPAARNLIAGNTYDGVLLDIEAVDTRILGNLIGTTRTGAAPLGNGDGIEGRGGTAFIGGTDAAHANVIAFNDRDGVNVHDGTGVRVLRNSIFANGEEGIDLGSDGVTLNDDDDPDPGANTLQNFPVITEATGTRVAGTLNSTPNQTFALRLFSNSGNGDEGKVFEAGPLLVTTNAQGNARFAFTPTPPIANGRSVTATATNQGGSTSEFSAAFEVGPPS